MKIVADLHIHSYYSRATSKKLNLEHLWKWAQLKGVTVVGTGDISHPGWLAELRAKLEPAEEGLYRLRESVAATLQEEVPPICRRQVRFLLTGEISNIYKRHDKVRKVHNLIFAPTLDLVETVQARLETIGNIRSDGRPILGLDSRDLLEIVLETDERCHLIPAHIWTPWFSMLGSKSGFDTVEECFGDLSSHIFAVETGLSSDPPMNRRVSMLDHYTLVSNSDAHSPQKLAREATLFETELSYQALFAAMQSADPAAYRGTIEFFPEEGKYHHDGHRKCGVSWSPRTTLAHDGLCAVCGRPVTVGVSHRVETLADREKTASEVRAPVHSLIPLPEIVSELVGVGVNSKKVQREYMRLLAELGPELEILLERTPAEIEPSGGSELAQGIVRMRRGCVVAEPGYDGEYGVIRLFRSADSNSSKPQLQLFVPDKQPARQVTARQDDHKHPDKTAGTHHLFGSAQRTSGAASSAWNAPDPWRGRGGQTPSESIEAAPFTGSEPDPATAGLLRTDEVAVQQQPVLKERPDSVLSATNLVLSAGLNEEQHNAMRCVSAPLVIVAGPGTGKTRTLTHRIAHLIQDHGVNPSAVLAVTFTNRAAAELTSRLADLLGEETAAEVTAKTFHAFGAQMLATYGERIDLPSNFVIGSTEETRRLFQRRVPDLTTSEIKSVLAVISAAKNQLLYPEDLDQDALVAGRSAVSLYLSYERALRDGGMLDFEDLIFLTVQLFEEHPDSLQAAQARFRWISVDEYQDVNPAQYRLLRLLTKGGSNLCVIGDPDQAIYSFRGADRSHFLAFHQDYPGARILHLSRSYRSVQTILDAAQQVIARSPDRDALRIWTDFVEATQVSIYKASTDKAEAEYVVHQIEQMVGGTSYFSVDSGRVDDRGEDADSLFSFGDFAVLYRTAAQAHCLREAFDRSGIPYQCRAGKSLTDYDDVQRILCYLWLRYNPASTVHWDLLLNRVHPTGNGRKLLAMAELEAFVADMAAGIAPMDVLEARKGLIPGPDYAEAVAVVQLHRRLAGMSLSDSVGVLLRTVARPDTPPPTQDGETADAQIAGLIVCDSERLRQLQRRARLYGDRLGDFLASYALENELDFYDPRADRVGLMTLHASKGLEFSVVFVVGCEEGLLPYRRSGNRSVSEVETGETEQLDEEHLDEERRLFYVGMTRARRRLILIHAQSRVLYGQRMTNDISRFVANIERSLLVHSRAPAQRRPHGPDHIQLTLLPGVEG